MLVGTADLWRQKEESIKPDWSKGSCRQPLPSVTSSTTPSGPWEYCCHLHHSTPSGPWDYCLISTTPLYLQGYGSTTERYMTEKNCSLQDNTFVSSPFNNPQPSSDGF